MPGILKPSACCNGQPEPNDYKKFKEFSALVNQENRKPLFLRGCVNLKKGNPFRSKKLNRLNLS